MNLSWQDALDLNSDIGKKIDIKFRRLRKTFSADMKLHHNIHILYMDMLDLDNTSDEYKEKQRLTSKLYHLMYAAQKNYQNLQFELDLLDIDSEYYLNIINDYNRKSQQEEDTWIITSKNHSVKRISRNKRRKLENETCAICLDTHGYKDIVKTSCGHVFGRKCIQQNLKCLRTSCPMCRSSHLSFSLFTSKK